MNNHNRATPFNRRLSLIRDAAEALAELLHEDYDPLFGRVQSEAIEEVNEALIDYELPLRLEGDEES